MLGVLFYKDSLDVAMTSAPLCVECIEGALKEFSIKITEISYGPWKGYKEDYKTSDYTLTDDNCKELTKRGVLKLI